MLRRLSVKGFKSLADVTVEFPRLTVLFGPNAAGKSNVLDAVQVLSRISSSRTLSEALADPVHGHPIEAFSFPAGGLPELLGQSQAEFTLDADVGLGEEGREPFNYRITVAIQPESGGLSVRDEYLAALSQKSIVKGTPRIECVEDQLRIRRQGKGAHPLQEPLGLNHTLLSDPRLSGDEYRPIERCRGELSGWRAYYLDPRVAMRAASPPSEVNDIGVLGENIAPFLYRLKAERRKCFAAVRRALCSLIPSIENVDVDMDKQRGTLNIQIRQDGCDFSTRLISEGTLRVLALCAICVNPWGGSLVAFEEPENGIHPRRLDLIVQLLSSLALERGRQVIITTHSPRLCEAVLNICEKERNDVALLRVRQGTTGTEVTRFDVGPLFRDQAVAEDLRARTQDGLFEGLLMRGLVDE